MPADAAIEAEIANMELAFRMQTEAPDLMNLAGESDETQAGYGIGERVRRPALVGVAKGGPKAAPAAASEAGGSPAP